VYGPVLFLVPLSCHGRRSQSHQVLCFPIFKGSTEGVAAGCRSGNFRPLAKVKPGSVDCSSSCSAATAAGRTRRNTRTGQGSPTSHGQSSLVANYQWTSSEFWFPVTTHKACGTVITVVGAAMLYLFVFRCPYHVLFDSRTLYFSISFPIRCDPVLSTGISLRITMPLSLHPQDNRQR
jgi:hypothetical protein